MDSIPRLPPHPCLDHVRKQAKATLKAHQAKDNSVCDLLRLLRRFAHSSNQQILATTLSLHEVQYALAMKYGFPSWAALKKAIVLQTKGQTMTDYETIQLRDSEDLRYGFVYCKENDEDVLDLYLCDPFSGLRRNLTRGQVPGPWCPSTCPTGRFVSFRSSGNPREPFSSPRTSSERILGIIDVDAELALQWVPVREDFLFGNLSPDGRRLAYGSYQDPEEDVDQLVVVDVQTHTSDVLTTVKNPNPAQHDRFPLVDPRWSPDGEWIACNHGPGVIRLLSADSKEHRDLSCPGLQMAPLAWSPDGTQLAAIVSGRLSILSVEGKLVRQYGQVQMAREWSNPTSWSADGAYLAYETREDQLQAIQILSLSDGQTRTVDFDGLASSPAWAPDRNELVFFGHVADRRRLSMLVVGMDGRPPRIIEDCSRHGWTEASWLAGRA